MAGTIGSEAVTDVADLITALAALAWPMVALFFLWRFHSEFSSLIGRLRELKAPGVETKFDSELDNLQAAATDAAQSLPRATGASEARGSDVDDRIRAALDEAADSPRVALMVLAADIEREVREIHAVRGNFQLTGGPLRQDSLRALELSPTVMRAVDEFRQVRNRIVHGHTADDAAVLRAIDAATIILEALDRVPREMHYVAATHVPLYADESGETRIDGAHAVVLQSRHSDDDERPLRAYPTTRDHFREGEPVSWEWNTNKIYGEAWLPDPLTGQMVYGWTESAEFVGRHLADL